MPERLDKRIKEALPYLTFDKRIKETFTPWKSDLLIRQASAVPGRECTDPCVAESNGG